MWRTFLIILLYCDIISSDFSPDASDYDAYGLKIAANDIFAVGVINNDNLYIVQFAPYNYSTTSLQCGFYFDDDTHYIYSVGVGTKQNTSLNPYFYFNGDIITDLNGGTDYSGNNGTFIGVWINNDSLTVQNYITSGLPIICDYFQVEQVEFLSAYDHQEFYVMAIEPYGTYAIGLASDYAFIYRPYPTSTITVKPASSVWPNNETFYPMAADASTTYTIVAGFVANDGASRVRATPTVYLISNANLTVLSTWSYSGSASSWQSRLTYSDVSSWNNKNIMSVKINPDDPTRALIGIQCLNTVFLLVISNNGANLTMASSVNNGQALGFGKSVTWLTVSQAAILANVYSMDYQTWYSSNIYLYTLLTGTTIPGVPTAIIPNSQQLIPSAISSELIQMTSTPESLVILDIDGDPLFILAAQPGFYASTDTSGSGDTFPIISHSAICNPGTYKSDSGVHPCTLCPTGTRNPGTAPAASCINCSSTNFCPSGAVYDVNSTAIASISQAYAYPRSPDMTAFEDILLMNMFSLSTTTHCLLVSPMFWALLLLGVFLLASIGVIMMNWLVQPQKSQRWRTKMKNIFQSTDLVGEGELWVGGLASLIIILITAMASAFAALYLNQYPSEKVGPSSFACDTTIRNAKFSSSLQALAVPISEEEDPIFILLDEQNFTFQIDFVNTNFSCNALSFYEVISSSSISLNPLSCSDANGILSATVSLPEHTLEIEIILSGVQLVGGMRIGLSGPGQEDDSYSLQELNFMQAFYSSSGETLSQQVDIYMELTKVINETEPLSDGDSDFSGIWYPTFTYSSSQMFIDVNSYVMIANLTSTTITIDISETSYYVQNVQSPIAKQPEVIFHTLLFTIVCLELCGLLFVVCKLLVIPLIFKLYSVCTGRSMIKVHPEHESRSDAD